ncbi:hypothetical protein ACFQ1I_21150 [Kitasatospora arboriphila]
MESAALHRRPGRGPGRGRVAPLGQDGLIELIADHHATGLTRGQLVDSALAEVEELNGGALTDDVAVLLLERNPVPALMG